MDTRREGLGPASQKFVQVPSASTNTNARAPEATGSSTVRPVLNFSIQTGEEFALEFMRERAISKNPSASNSSGGQNHATGYMDLRGMLGISHAGSESGSDVSMLMSGDKSPFKEMEKRNLSEIENKGRYASSRSAPRPSLGISHGHSSSGASDSSKKMKVLCSFGGKILPRPSDSKLRYVGGDTRIIRISKDISWQELMQKTLTVYNQPHTIKYQLPGEDLDALVSVSCDEDLQNMMEECSFLGGGEGSQKLRMFLFSSSDFDETHYGLGSTEGDSEVQYVVAVNGIDQAVRSSSEHGFATTSASNMDQLLNLKVEFDRNASNRAPTESAGNQTAPFSGNSVPPTTASSLLQESSSRDCDSHLNLHNNVQNANSRISIPGSVPSDYGYSSQYAPPGGTSAPLPPNDLLFANQGFTEGLHGTRVHSQGVKESKSTVDNSTQQKGGSGTVQTLGNESTKSMQKHDDSVSKHEPATETSNVDSYTDYDSEFNEDDQYASGGVFDSGFSDSDPISRHTRVFHSERIPREQAAFMNRLSKSDDSIDPQYLLLQSQSWAARESIAEGADPLDEGNLVSHSGKSSAAKPPLPTTSTIENGLYQFEKNKELVNTITKAKMESVSAPEVLVAERTEGAMVESSTIDKGSASKQQENPATILPEIHWEELTVKVATEQASDGTSTLGKKDTIVDINDRLRHDLLTDIFSKARLAEDSSGVIPLRKEDAGISVNMQNHQPKRWSFFRNLAQAEFTHKGISLMDQDHINSSPLKNEGFELGQMDSQMEFNEELQKELSGAIVKGKGGEGLQVENPYPVAGENTLTTDSAYEELKFAIGEAGQSVVDASVGDLDLSDLQTIKNDDLEELKELGSGTFGTVYHGKWRGSDVAIKRIKKSCFTGRSSEQERLTLEFWREAEILSRLHHPNVVAFYGVVQDGPGGTLATVTEYMVNGSLRHVLLRKDKYLDRRKRLIIAMDAAFGMEYLHSKNIVHFDLKCDNLLVNLKDQSRPICKVGDFGLSKIKRNTLVSGGVRGTLPWMAPELLHGSSNKVSEKVDVFSFGIVMWEILTGEEPYANMHYGAIIGGIVNNTLRPLVPVSCDPEWRRLMEQCWAPDPQQRPTFTQIASRLRSMSVAIQSKTSK
ncbi:uncharacterized protein A4U43_C06F3420 [Asparagus officinalis]|uniref:Protein kinase domain-containing protein n=1 Tax=Asparagus officinalis TaxID=4686 RepID=A0A5P1ELF2_ASPOF|nr:uncharacterized protein LOC109844889 [Asparagus officinalis]XP_020269649.1 uncharacterized protein LOC109844889 [Asparagus officinalis]ONK66027.1 uncharacterized protein A4U43_C06F3420 [Asparagus officinalis]